MFDFSKIFECIQKKDFSSVLEILEKPIVKNNPIVLSALDVGRLFEILISLNEISLLLPENTGEYERLSRIASESMAHHLSAVHDPFDFDSDNSANITEWPSLSNDFKTIKQILRTINNLMCISDKLVRRNGCFLVSPILLEFLINEENQARGFLNNVIFQNFLTNLTLDSRHPLFQRLINDEDFTRRICRDINPNFFATERGEAILTFAIQHHVSAECFDALIANGADINGGEKNLPYAFDSRLYRHYALHQQDPLSFVQYNHLEPRVLHDAKIYLNGEVKTPLIQAILSGNFAYVNRLLQEQHISLAKNPNNGFFHFIHEWRNASPLMLAAYLGQLDTVIALLAHGANINEVDEFGESAIFYALRGNQATVFYSLLEQAGINIALVNTIGQSLHDLMHQFNYPEIQQFFDPRERLEQLISNYPGLLSSILSEHIENKMPAVVMGLEREEVIPSLTRLQLEQQVQLAGFPLFQEAGGVLANEDYFQDTFITLSENHFQRPFITEGRRDSSYLVMGCHNGRYQIRHNPYSVSRAYHLLTLAHQLTHLNEFSAVVLLDFVSYLNLQDILDLFESPEIAMQILLNPEYVHAQQP